VASRPPFRWRPFAILAVALLVGAYLYFRGGAPDGPARPVEVKGRLEDAEGEPLPGLSLRFHAQDEANRAGPSLLCLTQPNGEFVGRCLPGRYRVTLSVPPGKGKGAVKVPARYKSVAETPWEVKVPPGGASGVVLKLGE
jgi:hypothetical protein